MWRAIEAGEIEVTQTLFGPLVTRDGWRRGPLDAVTMVRATVASSWGSLGGRCSLGLAAMMLWTANAAEFSVASVLIGMLFSVAWYDDPDG